MGLLTLTIKASFAKKKWCALFAIVLGDKRLRKRDLNQSCEHREGGFGYLVCHNKGHFCHKHRQCDIRKVLRINQVILHGSWTKSTIHSSSCVCLSKGVCKYNAMM